MNTIIFLAGMGNGAVLTLIIMLCFIGRSAKDGSAFHKETSALMRERNELDKKKVEYLERISATFPIADGQK